MSERVFWWLFGVVFTVIVVVVAVAIIRDYRWHTECVERGGKIVRGFGCIATRPDGTLERR